jgi:hypothetical protein
MRSTKHILDNKMTYMDFLSLTEDMTFHLENNLSKLLNKPKKTKKEIYYEIY